MLQQKQELEQDKKGLVFTNNLGEFPSTIDVLNAFSHITLNKKHFREKRENRRHHQEG